MELKTLAIVQARTGSSRLPAKVLKRINNTPVIELLLKRLSKSSAIDKIIMATTSKKEDDSLANLVNNLGFDVFRGSVNNVLKRFYEAANSCKANYIVRITGDCPLIDVEIVDQIINKIKSSDYDYVSNTIKPTFADGLDTEVFSFEALQIAFSNAKSSYDKEHVTPFIKYNSQFKTYNVESSFNYSVERWTIDESKDFELISSIFSHFNPNIYFKSKDILDLKTEKPELFELNKDIIRDEGSKLNSGQKFWKRAKSIIPGGNMLLSKRPELFLPNEWPTYFKRAKGCKVWDLDDKEYLDLSTMGIGTNTLGYGYPEIDEEVKNAISSGNMSTLNCKEEILLAEKLIELHPWADMVRFARTGGEANAISVRIARAASGKDNIAICGYHGWHDWYLASNLSDDSNLNGYLLPGLKPKGVPQVLDKTIFPFRYNDLNELKKIVKEHEIGVIKMEVVRNIAPENNFLLEVRKFADKNNIILIFDECSSGFRETNGGIHKKYNIFPDMAIFGKALGNGYAITAVIGKRVIMEEAQSTFISSTFWTERIGPVAGLKTLEVMNNLSSWDIITQQGLKVQKKIVQIADSYKIPIEVFGIPALTGFNILLDNWLKYKTLICQEMLKSGILASNLIYLCIDHNDEILDIYFNKLDEIFKLIKDCQEKGNIDEYLHSPVCQTGFQRLN